MTRKKRSETVLEPDTAIANLCAERVVLGSSLEEDNFFPEAISAGLSEEDFFMESHRRIFAAMLHLYSKGCPIDYVSVAEVLGNQPIHFAQLSDLVHGVVIARSHLLHHIGLVKKKSQLRKLLHLADWISSSVVEMGADPEMLLNEMRERLDLA